MRAKLNTKTHYTQGHIFNMDQDLAWKRRRLYARLSFYLFFILKKKTMDIFIRLIQVTF